MTLWRTKRLQERDDFMTYEQEKMFEENKNLVHGAIKSYIRCAGMYGLNDYDDLVQIGYIGLCKAVLSYDPNKAQFSTYAYKTIRNHLYNALRDAGDIQDNCESLEDEDLFEQAYEEQDFDNDMVMRSGLDIIADCSMRYTGIAKKGAEAIRLSLMGYECNEIAAIYGVSSNSITAWMSRARRKLQNEPEVQKLLGRGVYA